MRPKFIRFVDSWEYDDRGHGKCYINATILLNRWLKENSDVKIANWTACSTGKDSLLTIVVEYYEEAVQ